MYSTVHIQYITLHVYCKLLVGSTRIIFRQYADTHFHKHAKIVIFAKMQRWGGIRQYAKILIFSNMHTVFSPIRSRPLFIYPEELHY